MVCVRIHGNGFLQNFPYLNGDQGLTDTDWQDAIFRSAATTSHNVSLSPAEEDRWLFYFYNYCDKEGIGVINSDSAKI